MLGYEGNTKFFRVNYRGGVRDEECKKKKVWTFENDSGMSRCANTVLPLSAQFYGSLPVLIDQGRVILIIFDKLKKCIASNYASTLVSH